MAPQHPESEPVVPPATVPPAPLSEPPPQPPPPPPAATSFVSPISQTNVVNRSASSPRNENRVAARPTVAPRLAVAPRPAVAQRAPQAPSPVSPPRITASGYTYQPQRQTAVDEPLDTLERRMEAEQMDFADADEDSDDESLDD